jgi:CARDB
MSSTNMNSPANAGVPQPIDLTGRFFDVLPDVFPNALDAGSNFSIDVAIQNSGDFPTGSFEVYFFLSKDGVINSSTDLFLGSAIVNNLQGPDLIEFNQKLTLPPASGSFWDGDGKYYIGMIIDPKNLLREGNEGNNANVGLLADYDEIIVNNT